MPQRSPAQPQPGGESPTREHPLLPLKRLPNDARAVAAEEIAKGEIRKLDALLLSHGTPATNHIEKAILTSDIGITPANDGKIVRLPVPPLTEERRKQMAKSVATMAEQHRVAVRHIRQASRDQVQKMQKDKQITEDDERNGLDRIQKMTDGYIRKIDEIAKKKEQELMKV